ncbi:class I SAM-dependent methyltransferase [Verrucosispora sp. WMMA2044]|uniref:class I SAM-dependent methyltransferase n=1 Tax=Verrucosispora sp. WMMA2044 TaxID=3016419 RepID=UPI00248C2413|nr:class I SAM-dependent methyltransferase [Verrucosispora sp. WMMA2044]WBB46707.1 class I SAM-dependent methyltransferase [Verrucosispora sp. WMMA2044]
MTTETASAVTLPGGEMLAWSDRTDPADDGPLAALAARLVPAGARVLLAGPHGPAVLDALAHTRLTCLLRGYPDATAVAGRVDRVLVSGPRGLPAGEEYDVVIAGAGLDAIESVEGERLGWDELLARLVAAVRPGGDLLLRLDNPLGVHRLTAAESWYAGRGDAEWTVGGVLDAARPANLAQVHERLTVAGMRVGTCYAGYPRPDLTTALLAADELARHTTSGLFDAVLHAACTDGYTGRFVLADPARLAVDALHAGRAADLAPSWLVLARRPATGSGGTDDDSGDPPPRLDRPEDPPPGVGGPDRLPVAFFADATAGGTVVEVRDGPPGWHWHQSGVTVPAPSTDAPNAGREPAHRDPAAPDGPVPDGRLLRSLLLDGCLRRDTALLRRLLRGYADWLDGQAEQGRLAGAVALAGADSLVVDGDRWGVLDRGWRADAPLPVDVVLVRTLWRFAADLLTGGYAHPWTSTLDVTGLTVLLGGVAGRDVDRAAVEAAMAKGATAAEAEVSPTDPPPGPRSYQQLREAWLRQREENTRLTALLTWTENLLTSRERALRRAEAKINLMSGSLSYKVGRLALTPARMAKRGARAAKRRARTAIAAKQGEQK